MTIRFMPLCTVDVSHAYYANGRCRDVSFVIPPDTARLLRNGRLVAKSIEGRLHLLFEADDAGAAVTPLPGAVLRFGLRLLDAAITNITALGFVPGEQVAVYRNAIAPAAFDPAVLASPTGPVLSHVLQRVARPVTVSVEGDDGATVAAQLVTSADIGQATFDLTGRAPGQLMVDEAYPVGGHPTATYYLDPEFRREGVVAAVEIRITEAFYAAAKAFSVPLAQRQEPLRYFVVARKYSDAEFNQLTITDTGFAAAGRPEVKFTRVASAAFTAADLPAGLLGSADAKVVLFKSQAPVARIEGGRRSVQLKRHTETLIEHLPQPGTGNSGADLIIHVSKP